MKYVEIVARQGAKRSHAGSMASICNAAWRRFSAYFINESPTQDTSATLNKSPRVGAPRFGMGCKAQSAAIAEAMASIWCVQHEQQTGGESPNLGPWQREPNTEEASALLWKPRLDQRDAKRWEAREGVCGRSRRCVDLSNESEAP